MVLGLDTRRQLRGVAHLQALVQAVIAAGAHDEADWIEWKSTLDLSTKDSAFQLARTILGMANRMPATAVQTCEGVGYIVVGASPGSPTGVTTVDHAELERGVNAFVGGARGPSWTPTWVTVDSTTTLVITIEPPRPGDPVWPLRREFNEGNLRGRVFVRKHGRTDVADDADIDALSRRAADRAIELPELVVDALFAEPLAWFDPDAAAEAIAVHSDVVATGLLRRAEQRDRDLRGEVEQPVLGLGPVDGLRLGGELAKIQRQMQEASSALSRIGLGTEPEDRSLDAFRDEVDRWTDRWSKAATEDLPRRLLAHAPNEVAFDVRNLSRRFLTDLELRIDFEQEWLSGYEHEPKRAWMPSAPREWGTMKPSPLAQAFVPNMARTFGVGDFHVGPSRRSWIEDGSVHVVFDVGVLRPSADDTTDVFQFLLDRRPADGVLRGTWSATMRDLDDVVSGVIEIPVASDPVDVGALYEESDDD